MQEAPASLNFRVKTRKGYDVQFTLRDISEEKLLERFGCFIKLLEAKGIEPESNGQASALPATAGEPAKTVLSAANGNGQHAAGEYEVIEGGVVAVMANEKGEKTFKFKGGKYRQFGVRCWPETLEKLGWNLESLQIGKEYALPNWRAKVQMKEGKANKVAEFVMAESITKQR